RSAGRPYRRSRSCPLLRGAAPPVRRIFSSQSAFPDDERQYSPWLFAAARPQYPWQSPRKSSFPPSDRWGHTHGLSPHLPDGPAVSQNPPPPAISLTTAYPAP